VENYRDENYLVDRNVDIQYCFAPYKEDSF